MARKMVLVPENYLSSMHQHQKIQTTPAVKTLGELDTEMSGILSRHDIGDDEKVKLYNQAMQKYQEFDRQRKVKEPIAVKLVSSDEDKNKSKEPTEKIVDTNPMQLQMEQEIIDSVPKIAKNKAKLFINKLKQNKNVMFWNERGELTYDGKPVPGTNIVDLVRDTMSERKRFQPSSWDLFSRGLARVNTPLIWIGNETRKKAVQDYSLKGDSEIEEEDPMLMEYSRSRLSPPPSGRKSRKKYKTPSPAQASASRWISY